jgi:Flp pilus assembly pilin Flp
VNARIGKLVHRLAHDQHGLTTVEYAIVLCLIAAISVGAWNTFGKNVLGYLSSATTTLDKEMKPQ